MHAHDRVLKRRTFLGLAGASAAAAILAACGGSTRDGHARREADPAAAGGPTTAAQAAPTTAAPSAAVGTAAPAAPQAAPTAAPTAAAASAAAPAARVPSGTLRIAHPDKLTTLDPTAASSLAGPTLTVGKAIFDQLVTKDPVTGEYKPSLATKWETPDPATWIFTLRSDAKWHDGSPVTATDVKATLDRIAVKKGPIQPLWATLTSVEATSPTVATMKFSAPIGTVLAGAALLNILPAAKMEAADYFNKPIGSGPFKVTSFTPDSNVTLEANTAYWGGPPALQSLVFRIIPETTARITSIDTGEIDMTWTIPPDQLPKLKQNTNLTVSPTSSYSYYFLWMNAKRAAVHG